MHLDFKFSCFTNIKMKLVYKKSIILHSNLVLNKIEESRMKPTFHQAILFHSTRRLHHLHLCGHQTPGKD